MDNMKIKPIIYRFLGGAREGLQSNYLPDYSRRMLGIAVVIALLSWLAPDVLSKPIITQIPITFATFFIISILVPMVNDMGDATYNLTIRVLVNIINLLIVFVKPKEESEIE